MGISAVLEVSANTKATIQQQYNELQRRLQKKLDAKPSQIKYTISMASFHAIHTTPLPHGQSYTKKFNVVNISEFPMSCFTVAEPAPIFKPDPQNPQVPQMRIPRHSSENVTIADQNFPGIIRTLMPSVFKEQKMQYVAVNGVRYEFGDFLVQTGIVTTGSKLPKGIIFAVEYKPAMVTDSPPALLREFVQSLKIFNLEKSENDMDIGYNSDGTPEPGQGQATSAEHASIAFKISDFPELRAGLKQGETFKYTVQDTILQYITILKNIQLKVY